MNSVDKISQLAEASSDDKVKTFVFEGQGHTLGNALKTVLDYNPDVQFCGYSVPHPSEDKMHLRLQMKEGRAVDALCEALEHIRTLCGALTAKFEDALRSYHYNS